MRWELPAIQVIGLLSVAWLVRRFFGPSWKKIRRSLVGLLLALLMSMAACAAQLFPIGEFAFQSQRVMGAGHPDIFGFDIEPYRVVELFFPGVLGIEFPENRLWLYAIPGNLVHGQWTASLYCGALTILLAFHASRDRANPSRLPLIGLILVALTLSFGRFGSPLWWIRGIPIGGTWLAPDPGQIPGQAVPVSEGFGSPYHLLAVIAPGFASFRYPPKLLVFASVSLSTLAAMGWDRLSDRSERSVLRQTKALVGCGLALLALGAVALPFLIAWWTRAAKVSSMGGPIDPAGAWWEMMRGLAHGSLAMAIAGALAVAHCRGRRWAGAVAVAALSIDLAIAHHRLVWTVPQADLESPSRAVERLKQTGAADPVAGPICVGRLAEWHPVSWFRRRSPDRLREIVRWERETLQGGYGTIGGVGQALNPSALESALFIDLFRPWPIRAEDAAARMLGIKTGQPITYYPRRVLDLWGSRAFLLPIVAGDWLDPNRAIASFLPATDRLIPNADPLSPGQQDRWRVGQDWQLLENRSAFPRAWIVRDVRLHTPISAPEGAEYQSIKKAIQYGGDAFWDIPGRPVEDLRRTAWAEKIEASEGTRMDFDPANPSRDRVRILGGDALAHRELPPTWNQTVISSWPRVTILDGRSGSTVVSPRSGGPTWR